MEVECATATIGEVPFAVRGAVALSPGAKLHLSLDGNTLAVDARAAGSARLLPNPWLDAAGGVVAGSYELQYAHPHIPDALALLSGSPMGVPTLALTLHGLSGKDIAKLEAVCGGGDPGAASSSGKKRKRDPTDVDGDGATPTATVTAPAGMALPPLECSICFSAADEEDAGAFLALGCPAAHGFCFDCLQQCVKMFCQGESDLVCPGCQAEGTGAGPDGEPLPLYHLSEAEVTLVSSGDPAVLAKYARRQLHSALQGMADVIYCPAPGCENAIVLASSSAPSSSGAAAAAAIDDAAAAAAAAAAAPAPKTKRRRKKAPYHARRKRKGPARPRKPKSTRDEAFIRSLNPNQECVCDACQFRFCTGCQEPYHFHLDCAGYKAAKEQQAERDAGSDSLSAEEKRLAAEQKKNSAWAKKNTCPCPTCLAPIQKNGGCQYMHCSKCNSHFCWACMAPCKNHAHIGGRCEKGLRKQRLAALWQDRNAQCADEGVLWCHACGKLPLHTGLRCLNCTEYALCGGCSSHRNDLHGHPDHVFVTINIPDAVDADPEEADQGGILAALAAPFLALAA